MDFMTNNFEVKYRLPEVKQLFLNRQYRLCASTCARLLNQHADEMHHIHQAYFHFYCALSYDTQARAMHNFSSARLPTFQLAEKHYAVAIEVLTSSPAPEDEATAVPALHTKLSPIQESPNNSEPSDSESHSSSRRPSATLSRNSCDSVSTNPTVYSDSESEADYSDEEATPRKKYFNYAPPSRNILDDFSMTPKHSRLAQVSSPPTSPITPVQPAVSAHVDRYNIHLTGFVGMLHSHLHSVQEMKEHPEAGMRKSRPVSQDSATGSPRSRSRSDEDSEYTRFERKRISFRPRFDPKPYQELCRKALAEL